MPRGQRQTARRGQRAQARERRFDDILVLYKYCLNCFGINDFKALGQLLNRPEEEGENPATGNTKFIEHFINNCSISEAKLRYYDENIRRHTKQIGENRGGVTWKYFQYLALLFTEYYLDSYFGDKDEFSKKLSEHLHEPNDDVLFGNSTMSDFDPAKMNKLAYMCATGSGKTLIMHVNILQYLHYMKAAKRRDSRIGINKIIVLTPNEDMSNQHLEELKLSGLQASLFQKEGALKFGNIGDEIHIIDINKLKDEGKVKTVAIDSFERNNLLLVDEGHRGLSGDVWYEARKRIGEDGFTFEYSATFKQALKVNSNRAEDKALVEEYGKSIIIDYSYKYFYKDGYGKDYRIFNLSNSNLIDTHRQLYMTGCLLNFYQQRKCYEVFHTEIKPFNIENPLLVFVGNRVTAPVKSRDLSAAEKDLLTDVEEVITFIDNFVKNKRQTIDDIEKVITHNTGLVTSDGQDVFTYDFTALHDIFNGILSAEVLYNEILEFVFNTKTTASSPRLHLENVKAHNEIAMRIGEDGDYFGVINIGETSGLLKNLKEKQLQSTMPIVIHDNSVHTESLFDDIKKTSSKINVLIGSRKFTEGWSCWRVSTIGLINFAKDEGSQAIQMFGRGVRLKGYQFKLKRSHELDPSLHAPKVKHINKLETLTIFGVKANYMNEFRDFLEKEQELKPEHDFVDVELKTKRRYDEAKPYKLQVIRVAGDKNFKKQAKRLLLDAPKDSLFKAYMNTNQVIIDCRSKIQAIDVTFSMKITHVPNLIPMPDSIIDVLDYQRIYEEMELYKNEKAYYNLSIDKSLLSGILRDTSWYLYDIPKSQLAIKSMADRENMTDLAIMALKPYMDKYVKFEKARWEDQYLQYEELDANDPNLDVDYTIGIEKELVLHGIGNAIITDINNAIAQLSQQGALRPYNYGSQNEFVSLFDYPEHLYAPLVRLAKGVKEIKVTPVSLNDDEKKFVDYLNDYTDKNRTQLEAKQQRIFLLRNKSKVGMGFFEAGNFYPDYILWIDTPDTQYITFIDPKGLLHFTPKDEKIKFYKTIKELESRLARSSSKKIVLNSFIMSSTPAGQLQQWWHMKQSDYEVMNVYTLDDDKCVEKLVKKVLG